MDPLWCDNYVTSFCSKKVVVFELICLIWHCMSCSVTVSRATLLYSVDAETPCYNALVWYNEESPACLIVSVQPLASVFVSVGREGRGDSLSPEWHTLHRRRAGPLPSLCTAGLLPAIQPWTGQLCLVNTHTHNVFVCPSLNHFFLFMSNNCMGIVMRGCYEYSAVTVQY